MASRAKSKSETILEVLRDASVWELFYGPSGKALFKIPGSRGGTYTVSTESCTCPSDQFGRAGTRCKHVQAVRIYSRTIAAFRIHETQKEALRGHQEPSERGRKSTAGARQR